MPYTPRAAGRLRHISTATLVALLLLLLAAPTTLRAQGDPASVESCAGPVYDRKEVSVPARLVLRPAPEFTEETRGNLKCGTVKVSAVLCATGRVTDVVITQGLTHGMDEAVKRAARMITFMPAKKDGRVVSQRVRLEYQLNIDTCAPQSRCVESPELCANQLVEELQIEGNRRMSDEGILYYIKTRPGDLFDVAQVQRDLQSLLALPFFDKTETRVTTLMGRRGGVVVIFTVRELPVIRDLVFTGLMSVTEADVLKALRERRAGVSKESVYDPVKVRNAVHIIRELLAESGRPDAEVSALVSEISPQSVTLEFVIEEGPPGVPHKDEPPRALPREGDWWIGPIPLWRRPPALALPRKPV